MARYHDIHTHRQAALPGTVSIVNLYEHFHRAASLLSCSAGLHPWYLNGSEAAFRELETIAASPNVYAIGECGLDKLCDTPWQLQCLAFEQQIGLAEKLQKPLVIHCVRAFDEVMAMLAGSKVTIPVIFHGYNKKKTVAAKLLKAGYHLSLGAAILHSNAPATAILADISADRFFLETDDMDIPVSDLYKRAAEIRKTTEDTIILQLKQNFKTVFNR